MSRGPGRLQRWLLDNLPAVYELHDLDVDDGALIIDLAAAYYGNMFVTDGELSSVRRALRGLEKEGLARRWGAGRTNTWTLTPKPVAHLEGQRLIGLRWTDRCDSCARLFDDAGIGTTFHGLPEAGSYKVRGLALCYPCKDGTVDALSLASDGEYSIDRMPQIPCAQCGGEVSKGSLHCIYIRGGTLPLCDACGKARGDRKLASIGLPPIDVIMGRAALDD